ncbi:ATP-binding protein [Streptomyces sp. DSM 41524]|uniref:ATP-binding protein n=1 Tax=Streptomyces asiaticus subsp. ignotus TaxID=3098222 RepID=A0ABU7QCM8_9ACTN|nr:ATP-binding protein [Streptomyces sp. DSM 41524]
MTATARPSAIGAPSYSQSFHREPESAARVRQMVRTVLETWHLAHLIGDAEHVASELVANSVDHARGRCFRFVVTRISDHRVCLAVIDRSHDEPVRKTPSPDEERGRGLAVVEAFSASWGVDQLPWGKRVWTELEGKPCSTPR